MTPQLDSVSGINAKIPLQIHQGPIRGIEQQASTGAYWFQVGATGDSSSAGHYGASVMIRTGYDEANNDAHSYWAGGYLSNGAFVQSRYLTTVRTDALPYCCACFSEHFLSQHRSSRAPVQHPEAS